ncbi:Na+/H+ antiporter subunit E [Wolbachia pipientis]|uniref:Na+/H+ antiporter subunit E n=1 Tax=Wolbachia pipientis TaxID=955 RepID=A0A7G5CA92_WOLPI|nr:Na+/H+ antiporter subunit E [Wolbachia pipientis]QMV46126.1 Na+/H+ antiporter subunit E [Wolbachia pipientis]
MKNLNFRKEIKFFSLSFIVLFTLWAILSGYFEPFFIFCGVFSSIFTLFIFRRLINAESALSQILNGTSRLSFYKLVSYIPWLMYQIILSSVYVTKKVLQLKSKLEPIIILRKCKGHNDESIALFANSVTITPGTLTINVESKQKTYFSTIYLIDKDLESGISEIENKILKILRSVK